MELFYKVAPRDTEQAQKYYATMENNLAAMAVGLNFDHRNSVLILKFLDNAKPETFLLAGAIVGMYVDPVTFKPRFGFRT